MPPWTYGGLEVVLFDLATELSKMGHNVTVFAPNGTKIDCCQVIWTGEPLFTANPIKWYMPEAEMFDRYWEHLKDWKGIIHGHAWFGMEYQAKKRNPELRICHTHHGGIRSDWLKDKPFKTNTIAISDWMKGIYEKLNIPTRRIYNGVNPERYPLRKEKGDRYLWFSRLSFFKAPHIAIEIAKKTGIKLDIAGKERLPENPKYIEQIKADCDGDQIRFIGEVTERQKVELMSNAKALISTSRWGEGFGLHIVEAMMTGTGVLAIADGGINETVKVGGILCKDADELADLVKVYEPIDPEVCRYNAMQFSARKMAKNYLEAYRDILSGNEW